MKKIVFGLLPLLLLGCSGDDRPNNCNFLLDVLVNYNVNVNLPQFNQLQFAGSAIRVEGQGNNGLIIVAVNNGTLIAWDGSDPNHAPSSCSGLTLNNVIATCGCPDGNSYEVFNGQSTLDSPQPCTLKPYRVNALGNGQYLITN